jgi:ring-1,2-phenylacetyl-CoA epoxidase subunit PaaD
MTMPDEAKTTEADATARVRQLLASVTDPELPFLTIADLGILREIHVRGAEVEVTITPTYSGCPAMRMIAADIHRALAQGGFAKIAVRQVLSPPWTSDWLSADGRAKLTAYGIAPPPRLGQRHPGELERPACPRCGSADTERLAEFGSTACKALYRCRACLEPFDFFKCI